ncbi:Uma2 family endonuclease [Oscillatoriales cyanobacterium LEGE 11467]|uniref:Uma2 family endonuclease n=1 Tax=Zarconia navalis LEGE 11467 TaxID=1828826 RepID=A0A928VUK2_9CYAN|nr:Uma2 family endonuclease [Zarconia navalis]MBE9040609.1 Uma2 family endonuclease [Zarconia navalis LEGE 11467]
MDAAHCDRPLTAIEYLAWEASQEIRHEFIDGVVVAMTGGSLSHNDLTVKLILEIAPQVQPKGCRAQVSDAKVFVNATGNYFYPDLVVSCDRRDRDAQQSLQFPCLIIEVLSPSTAAKDRGKKLRNYRTIPTLQEYVLVDTVQVFVERYRRSCDLWTYRSYEAGDVVLFESIDVSIEVDRLYENIVLIPEEE